MLSDFPYLKELSFEFAIAKKVIIFLFCTCCYQVIDKSWCFGFCLLLTGIGWLLILGYRFRTCNCFTFWFFTIRSFPSIYELILHAFFPFFFFTHQSLSLLISSIFLLFIDLLISVYPKITVNKSAASDKPALCAKFPSDNR